jgi:hypothetical protein
MESFSKPSISSLQRVYSFLLLLRTKYYFIIYMINVRNLYLIYPDANHVTEKTIQSYGPKEKLFNIKYVTDNQRTCGALWYIGW